MIKLWSGLGLRWSQANFALCFCCLVFITLTASPSFASNQEELLSRLEEDLADSTRVKTLHELAAEFYYSNPDTALLLLNKAQDLAVNTQWKKGVALTTMEIGTFHRSQRAYDAAFNKYSEALNLFDELKTQDSFESLKGRSITLRNIGVIHYFKSEYNKALDYFLKALEIGEECGDKKVIGGALNNIGIIYKQQGNYPKALDYYFRSLSIMEELEDKVGIVNALGNIGVIYDYRDDHENALKYYFKSIEIDKELGHEEGRPNVLGNIGTLYHEQEKWTEALEFYYKALAITEEENDRYGTANHCGNIGSLFTAVYIQNKTKEPHERLTLNGREGSPIRFEALLDSSMSYQQRAYTIRKEIGEQDGITHSLSAMADIAIERGQQRKALQLFRQSYQLADSLQVVYMMMDAANRLYRTYKDANNTDSALYWHEWHIAHKDSLYNEEKLNEIGKLEARHEYETELLEREQKQEQKDLEAKEKAKRQQLVTLAAIGGGILMLVIALIALRGYRNKRKANKLLEDKNSIIEDKNKSITDSINYAKNIQEAILPFEERFKQVFSDYFILFKPKDIVSGDFYWFVEKDDKVFLAVVDCTGHGVPGAFMSMIGSAILNNIVLERNITHADAILNDMHRQVRIALKQEETTNKDGMDLGLCVFNLKTKTIEFAGAMNSLHLIKEGEFQKINGDRLGIGGFQHEKERKFTRHTIQATPGMSLYLTTDGYPDQFGGDNGKKYKYKRMYDLIQNHATKPMHEQKQILDSEFHEWKGDIEQIDDVCVIGVRV